MAALRLIAKSNFVDCMIGSSPGFFECQLRGPRRIAGKRMASRQRHPMACLAQGLGEAGALAGLEARDAECRSWSALPVWSSSQNLPKLSAHVIPAALTRRWPISINLTDDGAEGVGGFACGSLDKCGFFNAQHAVALSDGGWQRQFGEQMLRTVRASSLSEPDFP